MAGRPRKPTAIIEATGGYPRDRKGEPVVKGGPIKPEDLKPVASQVWDDTVAALRSVKGLLTRADGNILMRYANCMARYYEAQRILERDGVLVEGAKGNQVKHPTIQIIRDASTEALGLEKQMGLTPSARAGMKMPSDPHAEMDDMLGDHDDDDFDVSLLQEVSAGGLRLVES